MAQTSKEFKDYTKPELEDKLRQFEEELFNLKFQAKISQLDKPHRIKLLRRDIARINTFLRRIQLTDETSESKTGR
ncbi:MAG: 50S ribosomal protein L29 [Candidatus Omnitrophica bacterium]|nr:50S ribosomal protein L29 [Candidatus Omnitrophota bacterium]